MKEQLFKSIFKTNTAPAEPSMLATSLVVSLILGLVIAVVYKYKTLYSKEFVITLTVLPVLMTMIIFMVNGNLGTVWRLQVPLESFVFVQQQAELRSS